MGFFSIGGVRKEVVYGKARQIGRWDLTRLSMRSANLLSTSNPANRQLDEEFPFGR
jgi:hypothetical protein